MIRVILLSCVMTAGVPVSAAANLNLDVSPLRVTVQMSAGAEYTNAVEVSNSGDEPVRMVAYVEDWVLDEVGTPMFYDAGALPVSCSPWVDSAPADFLLEPGETETVRFSVRVPEGVPAGGYPCALILENLPLNRAETGGNQVFVRGRVACMVYVTVGQPGRSAEIAAMTTVLKDGKPTLRMQVANTGGDFIRLAGDLCVLARDLPCNKMVSLPDVPVLPGSARWVEVELPSGNFAEGMRAQVTLRMDGLDVMVGECSVAAEVIASRVP